MLGLEYISLPIKRNTQFYLTGTPQTHFEYGATAAVDLQITDPNGFIDYGAKLYSPIDGFGEYQVSQNQSALIKVTSTDNQIQIVVAHVAYNEAQTRKLVETFPRRVKAGELIGYQGNSGYSGEFAFPTHVHFEILENTGEEFENIGDKLQLCSLLALDVYCSYINNTSHVVLINDL